MIYNSHLFYPNSRFMRNAALEINPDTGLEHVLLFDLSEIPKSKNDVYFSVTSAYAYRLDLISNEFYNTTKLGWIIALANNKGDVLDFPSANTTIRIPAYQTVTRYI